MEDQIRGFEVRIPLSHSTQHEIDLIAYQLANLFNNVSSKKELNTGNEIAPNQ